MKTSYALVALSALSAHTWALPRAAKRDGTAEPITPAPPTVPVDDTAILNYALSLENLENAFYTEALARFDEQAFNQSGYPPSTRARYVMIGQHEQAHVVLLNQTLGENATQPCNYTFPYTDVPSFVNFSQILQGVATSAYIGALQNITNSTYLTVGASILATEARHAAWIASAVNNNSAWNGPYDTPLTPRQVITLGSPFISSCPQTNVAQPFTPFPPLNVTPGLPGSVVTFTFNASGSSTPNGTNTTSGDGSSSTTIDPNASPTSTTTDPNATSDGAGAVTTATDGSIPTADPSATDPSLTDPFPTDPSPTDANAPSDTSTPPTDGSDPSNADPNSPPDLNARQDSNTTIPDPSLPSNGTDGTTPGGTAPPANGTLFAAFLSGLETQFAPIGAGGNVTLPLNLTGQVYAVVTTSGTVVTDDTIVAGPAILVFNFDSQGNVTSVIQ